MPESTTRQRIEFLSALYEAQRLINEQIIPFSAIHAGANKRGDDLFHSAEVFADDIAAYFNGLTVAIERKSKQ